MPPRYLSLHEVPPGMIGNCPWGTPMEKWPTYMLLTAQELCSKPSERGYSDHLLGAIAKELDGRGRKSYQGLEPATHWS